jgi:hypothetical protein
VASGREGESRVRRRASDSVSSALAGLPSRGLLAANSRRVCVGDVAELRAYIPLGPCKSGAEPEVITTDQTNILIRSLLLRKQKDPNKPGKPRPAVVSPRATSGAAVVFRDAPTGRGKKRSRPYPCLPGFSGLVSRTSTLPALPCGRL